MKKLFRFFACSAVAMGCTFVLGCDDDSSVSPQTSDSPTSSAVENLSSSEALSSSVVESSSSASAPKTLCHIDLTTMKGYYPMAYNTAKVSVCLPMDNCDSLTLELGFPKCYNDHATVDGCYSNASPKVVEACDENFDDSCNTSNGTAYVYGHLALNCRNIVR